MKKKKKNFPNYNCSKVNSWVTSFFSLFFLEISGLTCNSNYDARANKSDCQKVFSFFFSKKKQRLPLLTYQSAAAPLLPLHSFWRVWRVLTCLHHHSCPRWQGVSPLNPGQCPVCSATAEQLKVPRVEDKRSTSWSKKNQFVVNCRLSVFVIGTGKYQPECSLFGSWERD